MDLFRFVRSSTIASQGSSIEDARANLVEALTLFFESADQSEISRRLHEEVFVTRLKFLSGRATFCGSSETRLRTETCPLPLVGARNRSVRRLA